MKKWLEKLVIQFENPNDEQRTVPSTLSEDRATLLFFLDMISKNIIETEQHPLRKVRTKLDEFAKNLLSPDEEIVEKNLFEIRQYFSSLRVDEYSYVQSTFNDFRSIIWDIVKELTEDIVTEKKEDLILKNHFELLKEAVDSQSIESLKSHSRSFIDTFVQLQSKKEKRRSKKVEKFRKNLSVVTDKLNSANQSLHQDHLTGVFNRKAFDKIAQEYIQMSQIDPFDLCLISMDIDHFKKINDRFGHQIGDHVIQECATIAKQHFQNKDAKVFRVGGEEFMILLPYFNIEQARIKCEQLLQSYRQSTLVKEDMKIQFTVSMGLTLLKAGESLETFVKCSDEALYNSKNTGRNKLTVYIENSLIKSA